jgi:transposase-like protein
LAAELGAADPVPKLPGRNKAGDLHHECHRVGEQFFKVLKNRGSFPNEDAVIKLVYLALRNISGKWSLPIRDWASAMSRFAIMFEGRIPLD